MKQIILLLLVSFKLFSQSKTAEDFGFRHIKLKFDGDSVDVLIKSKKGEENIPKPLFFFCQGSLPIPLIITEENDNYGTFPFNEDTLTTLYHIAIVSKPFVPLIVDTKNLDKQFCYRDTIGKGFENYSNRNHLSYYTKRNAFVVKYLQKQKWISKNKLVLAGHSEGSSIVSEMAFRMPQVTHLIYSGGTPHGRILAMIGRSRKTESDTDSTRYGEDEFRYWQDVVNNKNNLDCKKGGTYKATYDFSYPQIEHIKKLKIPVLVCYGSKDWAAPYCDLMRVEFIRENKMNVDFKTYIGTEHNYFPLKPDGTIDYSIFNWDKVAFDWFLWLKQKS